MASSTRRAVLVGVSGLIVPATAAGAATEMGDDMTLGRSDAPVTLIEYASPTALYCARWHVEEFPRIRERFIETGRVRLVLKEFITAPVTVAEDCFLICRAAGPARYFPVLEEIYRAWEALMESSELGDLSRSHEILLPIAEAHGVNENAFVEALSDQAARKALKARVDRNSWGVSGAPTFVFNDRRFVGAAAFDALVLAIEEANRSSPKA